MVDGHAPAFFRRHVSVSSLSSIPSYSLADSYSYVAMHAMQEDGSHGHDHGSNGYAEGSPASQRKPKGPQMRDTLGTMVGMLVPLLTQFGHHH